ncbi:hypothetical protein ACVR1G_08460 [Streptococcus dentasini]
MRLKTFLLSGLAGYGTYQAYYHRYTIRRTLIEAAQIWEKAQTDVTNIKDNLQIIQQELKQIKNHKTDLTYQFNIFEQEAEGRLHEIQQRMNKWQGNND